MLSLPVPFSTSLSVLPFRVDAVPEVAGSVAELQVVDADQGVAAVAAGNAIGNDDGACRAEVAERVVAVAPAVDRRVAAGQVVDQVVAGTARHAVIAQLPVEAVTAAAALQVVVAVRARDRDAGRLGHDGHEVRVERVEFVVEEDLLDAVEHVGAESTGDGVGQGDPAGQGTDADVEVGIVRTIDHEVPAVAALHRVVAAVRIEHVVAAAAVDLVVVVAAADGVVAGRFPKRRRRPLRLPRREAWAGPAAKCPARNPSSRVPPALC
jgi:hypothetical protein